MSGFFNRIRELFGHRLQKHVQNGGKVLGEYEVIIDTPKGLAFVRYEHFWSRAYALMRRLQRQGYRAEMRRVSKSVPTSRPALYGG